MSMPLGTQNVATATFVFEKIAKCYTYPKTYKIAFKKVLITWIPVVR
jgi:hypothetical protein